MSVRYQHKLRRLRSLLPRLQHLPLSCVYIDNEALFYPSSRRVDMSEVNLSPEKVKRLAHLFSVRGNFALDPSQSKFGLRLFSINPLLPAEFFSVFGGNIYSRNGRGVTQPEYRWEIYNQNAANVSRDLSVSPTRISAFLQSFYQFWETKKANSNKNATSEAYTDLRVRRKQLSNFFFEDNKVRGWSDLSELVDAKGHITLSRVGSRVKLSIVHPNSELLESARAFIESQRLASSLPAVGKSMSFFSSSSFEWRSQSKPLILKILRKLAECGDLIVQKQKIQKVMEILQNAGIDKRHSSGPQVSRNHKRYTKLDPSQAIFSELIASIKHEQWRFSGRKKGSPFNCRKHFETASLGSQLSALRQTENEKKSYELMRRDIRDLLKRGRLSVVDHSL